MTLVYSRMLFTAFCLLTKLVVVLVLVLESKSLHYFIVHEIRTVQMTPPEAPPPPPQKFNPYLLPKLYPFNMHKTKKVYPFLTPQRTHSRNSVSKKLLSYIRLVSSVSSSLAAGDEGKR